MKKDDLIKRMMVWFPSFSKKDAKFCVEEVFDAIFGALADGGEFVMPKFGKFHIAKRAERNGVNPRTGEKITIEAMKAPKFTPAKALRDAVKAA
jgi:DNA-binding protein HU-beta